jgi:hypothetical protein
MAEERWKLSLSFCGGYTYGLANILAGARAGEKTTRP